MDWTLIFRPSGAIEGQLPLFLVSEGRIVSGKGWFEEFRVLSFIVWANWGENVNFKWQVPTSYGE